MIIIDFNKFQAAKGNKNTFRNITLLPPFAVAAILSASSVDPAKLAQGIESLCQSTKQKLSDHECFDEKEYIIATKHVLSFIWCHYQKL